MNPFVIKDAKYAEKRAKQTRTKEEDDIGKFSTSYPIKPYLFLSSILMIPEPLMDILLMFRRNLSYFNI